MFLYKIAKTVVSEEIATIELVMKNQLTTVDQLDDRLHGRQTSNRHGVMPKHFV